jgi:hypothetical protein
MHSHCVLLPLSAYYAICLSGRRGDHAASQCVLVLLYHKPAVQCRLASLQGQHWHHVLLEFEKNWAQPAVCVAA